MSIFKFKQFDILQRDNAMKVGTDAMILGAFINANGRKVGLDIGAGTGVISLMVAQQNESIAIDAIEIDRDSAVECQINFEQSKWGARLHASCIDFLDYQTPAKYDLIFSNPPFYKNALENEDKRKAKARHETSLPMEPFVANVSRMIASDGDFYIIVPSEDAKLWRSACANVGLFLIERISVFGKEGGDVKRAILVFSKEKQHLEEFSFAIRNSKNGYTDAYVELTRDYHFNDIS